MSFIAPDRFLASEEFTLLAREIDKLAISQNLKPSDIYFAAKVIPKYDQAKAAKDPDGFTKKRAIPVKSRSRMPPAGSRMKMVIMLRLYKDLPEEFDQDIKEAIRAIEKHNVRAEKYILAGKESAKKKRDTLAKAFDKNLDSIEKVLLSAGLKSKDLAIGSSMMGKTMIVRLPNGGYVSVGKADEEKFLKAKEPAVASSNATVKPALGRSSKRKSIEPSTPKRRTVTVELPIKKRKRA